MQIRKQLTWILLILIASSASAQNIAGKILDKQGNPVPFAT